MAAEVVSLSAAREERQPHMAGAAACMVCHHSWQAVAPIGTSELECPECHSLKGYFAAPVVRGEHRFVCDCGCYVFHISPDVGPYCVACATPAVGWF